MSKQDKQKKQDKKELQEELLDDKSLMTENEEQTQQADGLTESAAAQSDAPQADSTEAEKAAQEGTEQAQGADGSDAGDDQDSAIGEQESDKLTGNISPEPFKLHIIVVTSGKGGVGKTTSSAAIATGLAMKGHKTAVIDFDVGLRNLDLIMGCERRVVYDFINVINGEAKLNQALIKDRHVDNLFVLPASQTKDKDALTLEGVEKVLRTLDEMDFEYVICDSPAGIETGALMSLYFADEAIVTTNPEVSSVRDSDRIIGILNARSRRAVLNMEPVVAKLLLTRYLPQRVKRNEMLSVEDVQELLTIPLLGVIPESQDVLKASNSGNPVILNQQSDAGKAYDDAVERLLGNEVPLRFTEVKKGLLSKIFKK